MLAPWQAQKSEELKIQVFKNALLFFENDSCGQGGVCLGNLRCIT